MSRLDELLGMRDFLDREIASERLRNSQGPMAMITRAADLYGVDVTVLCSGDRDPTVVRARQAASWLMHQDGMSLPQIGAVLGCHHTTVLNSVRRVDGSPSVRALLLGMEVAPPMTERSA